MLNFLPHKRVLLGDLDVLTFHLRQQEGEHVALGQTGEQMVVLTTQIVAIVGKATEAVMYGQDLE